MKPYRQETSPKSMHSDEGLDPSQDLVAAESQMSRLSVSACRCALALFSPISGFPLASTVNSANLGSSGASALAWAAPAWDCTVARTWSSVTFEVGLDCRIPFPRALNVGDCFAIAQDAPHRLGSSARVHRQLAAARSRARPARNRCWSRCA